MLVSTEKEIVSLMPTARWSRPDQLLGYLEEEEQVALEPLLGSSLYAHLLTEYDRLSGIYADITALTVKPTGRAKTDTGAPYADVTDRLDRIQNKQDLSGTDTSLIDDTDKVSDEDMATIRLIRICQQIEFYKMLAHKAGLLTVSFNQGGGMNMVSADGYEPADEKRMERVVKDAWMSAGRAVDSLLLFLEADAKGKKLFTEKWQEADAFYLHKDLLFQTARVLNEYLDIRGERMAYVALVRDIRFCQNTYLRPRVGAKLLNAVVDFANEGCCDTATNMTDGGSTTDGGATTTSDGTTTADDGITTDTATGGEVTDGGETELQKAERKAALEELLGMLRTALAFYVESRRTTITQTTLLSGSGTYATAGSQKEVKLARRDSMTDAQQAMAMACEYIEENLDALGQAVVGTPVYNAVRAREEQEERDRACACAAAERQRMAACQMSQRKLFTGFPPTHRTPERK